MGDALCGAEVGADSADGVADGAFAAGDTDGIADSPPLTGAATWSEPAVWVEPLFMGATDATSLTGSRFVAGALTVASAGCVAETASDGVGAGLFTGALAGCVVEAA